ncbi:unnamed protein product [Closterium sp. NIES-53]
MNYETVGYNTGGTAGAEGARAAGAGGAGGAGGATGAAGTGGARGTTSAGGARTGGTGCTGGAGATGLGGTAGAASAGEAGATGTALRGPFFYPQPQSSLPPPNSVLRQVLSLPSSTGLPLPLLCPLTDQSQPQLLPGSPLPVPVPHTEVTECREPETRTSKPVRARRVARPRPPAVPGTHGMALRPSSVPQRVVLPEPPASSFPHIPNPDSDLACAPSPTITRLPASVVTDPDLDSTAAFALVTEVVDFAARSRLDYVASLVTESEFDCPPSIGGPYIDEVPPPGVNIVDGMWIFRVKRPSGSLPAFKARYVARGFSQQHGVDFFQTFPPTPKMTTIHVLLHVAAQRDYELHSLDFSTAFLQGSFHEEIWLRRPPGFTGSFPVGTQTTLAALGFAPSSADPSLFLRTDTTLTPFYVLVYVDDLVFATADSEALALVKAELQERHTCTDSVTHSELRNYLGLQITRDRARRTITLTQSHMSVEPSGTYPELVGFLMYLMMCTRPDLVYPLSLLARYVAPDRHRKVHWDVAKRVLRYLCSTSGMGLVLGGHGSLVRTGHSDTSWANDQVTQHSSKGYTFNLGPGSVSWRSTRSSYVLSSSCEAEIYAGAMAA